MMQVNINKLIVKTNNTDIITRQISNVVQCKICYNILSDPYDCQCCLQTFCGQCIKGYIKTNNHCPFSEFFSNNPFPNSPLSLLKKSSSNITQLISSLRFKCKNYFEGCKTELTFKNLTEHERNCNHNGKIKIEGNTNNMETPPNYKFKGKEMSFRNMESFDKDNENSFFYSSPSYPCHNEKALMEKVDKIYEMLNNFIYSNKSIESTPKFEKRFSLYSPDDFPNDNKNNNNNGHNEPLFNIANELTVLNEKISSIENKITNSNSTTDSSGSINNKKKNTNEVNVPVSMFDNYMLNSLSIGSSNQIGIKNNKQQTILNKNNKEKKKNKYPIKNEKMNQSFNGKQRMFQTQTKLFEVVNNDHNKSLKRKNTNASMSMSMIEDNKKTILLLNEHEKIIETSNNKSKVDTNDHSIFSSQYKDDIIAYIDDKCNKEIKQYILELTLDNSNLFVQKIDEVLDKITSTKLSIAS